MKNKAFFSLSVKTALSGRNPRFITGVARLLLLCAVPLQDVCADTEFLAFPSLNAIHRSALEPGTTVKKNDLDGELDLFLTSSYGQTRLLAEYFISEDEGELERLQLGRGIGPESTLWLGRFHSPIGYWHSQYHHGNFLQTSITHPGIVTFEDSGGPLPNHISGLMWETKHPATGGNLAYAMAAGVGPQLEQKLIPVDLLKPNEGHHKFAAALRISYQPGSIGTNEAGLFAGYARIPGNGTVIGEIKQKLGGAFGNWQGKKLRLIGSAFWLDVEIDSAAGIERDKFSNAYGQAEYNLYPDWTLYGRVEDTFSNDNNIYLSYFPAFIETRRLAGVRYDINNKHALKLEISRMQTQTERYKQVVLQWSAVLP